MIIPFTFDFNEPRYLDGNVFNGQVQMVKSVFPPFSGTRWFVSEGPNSTSFACLGAGGDANSPRMLDGWIEQGTVQLRQPLDIFTGIKWSVETSLVN